MTIRGKRHYPYPGGRWYLWAMEGDRVLAAYASTSKEWMELLNCYRCLFTTIKARPA